MPAIGEPDPSCAQMLNGLPAVQVDHVLSPPIGPANRPAARRNAGALDPTPYRMKREVVHPAWDLEVAVLFLDRHGCGWTPLVCNRPPPRQSHGAGTEALLRIELRSGPSRVGCADRRMFFDRTVRAQRSTHNDAVGS